MKKTLMTLFAVAITATTFAQTFSIQLNTGFNYYLGTKADKLEKTVKPSFGSSTNGAIPIELEARYYVNENIFVNLNYAYQLYLGYSFSNTNTGTTVKTSINPQSIKLGAAYYFSEGTLRPYAGLDLNVLLVSINDETTGTGYASKSEFGTYTTVGFGPKIGVDYALSDKLFLNANLSYNYIISAATDKEFSIKNTTTVLGTTTTQTITKKFSFDNSNLLGLTIGGGYKI